MAWIAAVMAVAALAMALAVAARTPRRPAAPSNTGQPAADSARNERSVPFKPGETLDYDVSWAAFLTAGSATVTVREKRPSYDSIAYYVVAEGRPSALLASLYTIYYKADTLLDAFTLLPQRASIYSQEGDRRRTQTTRFDQSGRTARYEMTTKSVVTRTLKLRADTQDPLSALYAIRSLPLRQGFKTTMDVANADQILQVQVTVRERASIATPAGTFDAWRVTPVVVEGSGGMKDRALSVWISDTERRLPLKIEAEMPVGRFALTLRTARS
jgi:hypothetical protein